METPNNMIEERFQHQYLDHFRYTPSTGLDAAYGPKSPRLGDEGLLIPSDRKPRPFTVEVEPKTGLPALRVSEDTGVRWRSLMDVALESGTQMLLQERETYGARGYVCHGVQYAFLKPPYENEDTVFFKNGILFADFSGRRLVIGAESMADALRWLGYVLIMEDEDDE